VRYYQAQDWQANARINSINDANKRLWRVA
jgi:hypothetical protein